MLQSLTGSEIFMFLEEKIKPKKQKTERELEIRFQRNQYVKKEKQKIKHVPLNSRNGRVNLIR